uniref:Uncharacterized protein n=1 Tax=Anguilla anguilla TaxID=7936 RepID=A0A0E9UJR6_ANGAN
MRSHSGLILQDQLRRAELNSGAPANGTQHQCSKLALRGTQHTPEKKVNCRKQDTSVEQKLKIRLHQLRSSSHLHRETRCLE